MMCKAALPQYVEIVLPPAECVDITMLLILFLSLYSAVMWAKAAVIPWGWDCVYGETVGMGRNIDKIISTLVREIAG